MTDEITNEEALRSLALHYQRKAGELEEGLVVANAKIAKLEKGLNKLRNGDNDDPALDDAETE